MADCVKGNTTLALKEEVTEGVYVAPSAGTDFVVVPNLF